jgi:hypothetical protein
LRRSRCHIRRGYLFAFQSISGLWQAAEQKINEHHPKQARLYFKIQQNHNPAIPFQYDLPEFVPSGPKKLRKDILPISELICPVSTRPQ